MPSRVVIVDDKLPMAETLADGLTDRGYAARALGSGREALAAVAQREVDVLVLAGRSGSRDLAVIRMHRCLLMRGAGRG